MRRGRVFTTLTDEQIESIKVDYENKIPLNTIKAKYHISAKRLNDITNHVETKTCKKSMYDELMKNLEKQENTLKFMQKINIGDKLQLNNTVAVVMQKNEKLIFFRDVLNKHNRFSVSLGDMLADGIVIKKVV